MSHVSYAMILAGGLGSRLCLLSEKRAKPAVPFGGKYRIIDFTLSNCVNSGIFDIGILTQYRPLSLRDHIGLGRAWDLDRKRGGVELLQPFQAWEESDWYRGTADAVWQNWARVAEREAEHLLVLSGDHVYRMDYRPIPTRPRCARGSHRRARARSAGPPRARPRCGRHRPRTARTAAPAARPGVPGHRARVRPPRGPWRDASRPARARP
ncbi:MAG TPA: sugar phosphate nucleotidyltransferase, partial [Acidobacteriota bacterium]|nr:sugar phosphate nucleotidyltransferase [Acidobacteriota bacterium]